MIIDQSGDVIDRALVTYFKAPASYTGEDVVEIACHGGVLVTRRVLERLLEAGARAAEPGEFTERAFLHGTLDLTQAEAVMDLISAQTDLALRAAQRQLEGRLGGRLTALRDDLLEVLAHVEAYIDFPEEDIDPDTGAALLAEWKNCPNGSRRAARHRRSGPHPARRRAHGHRRRAQRRQTSLLNRLLGFERAIVSERPAPRATPSRKSSTCAALPLRLIDTAGLREAAGAVEREGVARTLRQLEHADLILEVVDASRPDPQCAAIAPGLSAKRVLVLNKTDLGLNDAWQGTDGVPVSFSPDRHRRIGGSHCRRAQRVRRSSFASEIAVSARHRDCLHRALQSLTAAATQLTAGTAPEFIALDLREALEALGEIVGHSTVDDLLGIIFSRFCIGK